MNFPPIVSVVVTTKNESRNIGNCLSSITNQTYNAIELIVVDNDSTDNTKSISKQFTNQVFNCGPERSAQRNYGLMNVAKGKYGMYIDADMILSPALVENCVQFAEENLGVSLYIPEIILGKSLFNRIRRYERCFYDGTSLDAIRFFELTKFRQINGFDQELFRFGSGEDWDLDKRMKLVGPSVLLKSFETFAWRDNNLLEIIQRNLPRHKIKESTDFSCIFHNESEIRFVQFLKKKTYYSQAFKAYVLKWGRSDVDIRKQFGISYRFLVVFLENGKWKSILSHPFLFFAILFYRVILALTIVFSRVLIFTKYAFSKIIESFS